MSSHLSQTHPSQWQGYTPLTTDAAWEDESYVDYYYDDPGDMPGTLTIDPEAPPPELVLIDYGSHHATRQPLTRPQECIPYMDSQSVSWLDVQGLGSEDILQELGQVFRLHPLTLEDIVNVPQRPKVEQYPDHILLIARMVTPREVGYGFDTEQVSFILGSSGYLLTVQEEGEHDTFASVRERIRVGKGMIRNYGADYLTYALLDTIVDGFFPVLELYGERLEELEDEVVINPTRTTLAEIHQLKRDLLSLRRLIWPLRDAVNVLIRDAGDFFGAEVRVYLRDCYDHTVQVMDIVETYREVASSLMDVYLSAIGNKMNEIMKFLTVISTIFIPLTFIAGVYGMNFAPDKSPWNMPELDWYWGYPFALGLMAVIAVALIIFFKRRGWFDNFSLVITDRVDGNPRL
ncbi:magnesium and cobalt transporter CorA [Gloeomargarita lithophora Alchichica-D10]|uniref:Magnesium transport protein CorA n=1 Tax=Gloeomargarita lithophora Alchichica-D10 TaxID=1188229 RepID=A0A1J0ACS4_9CYAN|nr:magnesium/cobalt transporter CorA [Gloeomargarita lithophora]APB33721.1 magnesium and cobalt transporter CorA [Gloeomargarita lithophora Alchichica-D10]